MAKEYRMGRVLGLDYGDRTIGVAVSDALNITAQSLETIRREDEKSIKKSVARLKEIIKEYEICEIVLGFPKNMDNTLGVRAIKTQEFKERLHRNFKKMPIVLWDERLSTMAVQRGLKSEGLSIEKREEVVDKLAAAFILQGYMDSKGEKN